MGNILVVDDEALIVKGISISLKLDGHVVDTAFDGNSALEKASKNSYDCILLDVMLPGLTGYEVCSKIREFSNVPIIMLTAKTEDEDKIEGLSVGADDYITKPFNILEVRARIKAVIRRNGSRNVQEPAIQNKKTYGDITVDNVNRLVTVAGKNINLTAKEFDILSLLLNNPNVVYSREKLLEILWDKNYPGDARTVDVHVRRLREKIENDPSNPKYIYTKWKAGYYFTESQNNG